jgi:hypothetical protein
LNVNGMITKEQKGYYKNFQICKNEVIIEWFSSCKLSYEKAKKFDITDFLTSKFKEIWVWLIKILLLPVELWSFQFGLVFFKNWWPFNSVQHILWPIFFKSSSTSSIHLSLGLPLPLLPSSFPSKIYSPIVIHSYNVSKPFQSSNFYNRNNILRFIFSF